MTNEKYAPDGAPLRPAAVEVLKMELSKRHIIMRLTTSSPTAATGYDLFKQVLRLDADTITVVGTPTPAVEHRIATYRALGIQVDVKPDLAASQSRLPSNVIELFCHA